MNENGMESFKSLEQYLDPDDQDDPEVLAQATDIFRDYLDGHTSMLNPDTPCLLLPPRTSVPEEDDTMSTSETEPKTDSEFLIPPTMQLLCQRENATICVCGQVARHR
jgi:hypothetical protein